MLRRCAAAHRLGETKLKKTVPPRADDDDVGTPVDVIGFPQTHGRWSLQPGEDIGVLLESGVAHLSVDGRRVIAVAPDALGRGSASIAEAARTGVPMLQMDRFDFGRLIESIDRDGMSRDAGHGLHDRDKLNSALHGIRPWQFALMGAGLSAAVVAAYFDWQATVQALVAGMIVLMAALVAFRLTCMVAGLAWQARRTDAADASALAEEALPSYSILVPMLRERESTIRGLVASLSRIDYPRDRLQALFILEDTDHATRAIVDEIELPAWFKVILVPDAPPHTKGKACNYAMNFVTGRYFTIYDAEDHPDPLQLKKAVAAFRREANDLICVQSRLNFYNCKENWLTRMFTLDYSAWYFFILPGLDALRLPICLGGTSNHFRSSDLRELGAWDAYNVTEDADLGLRIAKSGRRTVVIDSITYEEAVTNVPSWIRQRTRWIKGHMLTYLVHMRRPTTLLRQVGLWGFLGIQLFVAGNFLGGLIIPPLVAVTVVWAAGALVGWPGVKVFPEGYEFLAFVTLVIGNVSAIGFAMAAGFRRGIPSLALYALTSPLYWLLGVVATYRALWQVVFSPYHWEKTEHGVSAVNSGSGLGGHASGVRENRSVAEEELHQGRSA